MQYGHILQQQHLQIRHWLPLQVVVFGCRLRGLPRSVGLPRAAAGDASRMLGCLFRAAAQPLSRANGAVAGRPIHGTTEFYSY